MAFVTTLAFAPRAALATSRAMGAVGQTLSASMRGRCHRERGKPTTKWWRWALGRRRHRRTSPDNGSNATSAGVLRSDVARLFPRRPSRRRGGSLIDRTGLRSPCADEILAPMAWRMAAAVGRNASCRAVAHVLARALRANAFDVAHELRLILIRYIRFAVPGLPGSGLRPMIER